MKTFIATVAFGASVLFTGSAMADGPAEVSEWECNFVEFHPMGQEPAAVDNMYSIVNDAGNDYISFAETVPSPGYRYDLTSADGTADENFVVTMQGPTAELSAPTVLAETLISFEVDSDTNSFSVRFEKDYNLGYTHVSCMRVE